MSTALNVSLTVNGERVSRRVEARRHLVDFLRLDLGLMGTRTGCEHGNCGTCTVRVDGRIVRGCLVLAVSLDGAVVRQDKDATKEFYGHMVTFESSLEGSVEPAEGYSGK